LVLINRDDRISSQNPSITNEVKGLWHKAFSLTSMKKRVTAIQTLQGPRSGERGHFRARRASNREARGGVPNAEGCFSEGFKVVGY
jgi:hypothetical protein